VSPLWRDTVTVGVAPTGISALRYRRGLRPAVSVKEHWPCTAGADSAAVTGELPKLFDRPEWQHCDVRFILSSHFVRYAVVPGNSSVRTDAERAAFAQVTFEKVYGTLARDWDIRLSPSGTNEATLACGIDRVLLTALRGIETPSVRVTAIRPHLMCAFNAIAGRLNASPTAIALAESSRITLAFVKSGQWQAVSSRVFDEVNGEALQQALGEQGVLLGMEAGGPLWLNDLAGLCALPADSAWKVQPFGEAELDSSFRLAALGAAA
jgi:hypothetical protein